MNSLGIGISIFFILFCSSIIGSLMKRSLDVIHLSDATKDIVNAARGLIIGLTALTLGLLVSGAKSSYEEKESEIRKQAADISMLARVLNDFGPEAINALQVLRDGVNGEIRILNVVADDGLEALKKTGSSGMDKLRRAIMSLHGDTEDKALLKSSANSLAQSIIGAQLKLYYDRNSGIQWPIMLASIFWLTVVFFSFGIFAPINIISISALLLSAFSMSAALCLTMEYDAPYNGFVTISSSPLEDALTKFKSQ